VYCKRSITKCTWKEDDKTLKRPDADDVKKCKSYNESQKAMLLKEFKTQDYSEIDCNMRNNCDIFEKKKNRNICKLRDLAIVEIYCTECPKQGYKAMLKQGQLMKSKKQVPPSDE